jgi:TonB-dependent SusC/RagA subfamily outer membrane receptor
MKTRFLFLVIMLLCTAGVTLGQKPDKKVRISGIVRDADNRTVPGVVILIDNVKTNAITNEKGFYKVKAWPAANKIGIFSFYTGAAEQEIKGRTTINFYLNMSASVAVSNQDMPARDESVNVGYGNTRKSDLTQNVGKIDGRQAKYASYSSIYEMIKGEVAGVQVTGKSIKIQGANSFVLSTEPLFVVDGMTVNSVDDILPQHVNSIEVLKGSAASIYGSRGANGVILITTKSSSNR